MSNSKISMRDLQSYTKSMLHDRLIFLKRELFNLRFQKSLGELTNFSKFKLAKRDVARIMTELSMRSKIGE